MILDKKGEVVLEGNCKGVAGMWQVNLSTTPQPIPTPSNQPSNKLMAERTKSDLAQWYHTTLFSPVKQTVIQLIKKG